MEQLIKIQDHKGKKCISARDLHVFLESKKDFSDWFKHRVNKYGLIEKEDYILLPQIVEQKKQGGHNAKDYVLSINAAKELAMVEGNDKGKQARQYFIHCEKQLKEAKANLPNFNDPVIAAREWANAMEQKRLAETQKELLEKTIIEQAPIVKYHNEVLQSEKGWQTSIIASELGMSAVKLNLILKDMGIQRKMNDTWILTSKYLNCGYTKSKTHPYIDSSGAHKTHILTTWTEKGREFIHRVIKESHAA